MFAYPIYLLIRVCSFMINLLPEGAALWIGRQLGNGMYFLDPEHREVAIQNLHIAFGHVKTEEQIRSIAKKSFQNLGMTAVEFLRIPKMTVENFKEKVAPEGMESFLKKVVEREKGILVLLSHLGNWEMMGLMSKVLGEPVVVLARPVKKNRWLDGFVFEVRKAAGLEVIPSEKAGKKVIRALSQNRIVGILIDQRAKRSEGVWVDFFGRKAPTTPALAVLAMRTGVPVLPVFMIRNEHGRHHLLVKEFLQLVDTGDIKKDVETNTQIINDTLESVIRQYPDQWFWVHRRWERKKRPHHPRRLPKAEE